MSGLLASYRRTGVDPPFGDPGRDHGAPMEESYWRLVHPDPARASWPRVGHPRRRPSAGVR